MNYLCGELKTSLPEEEFAKLQDEQRIWIAEKEHAPEEAGKEVEGGTLYPLCRNMYKLSGFWGHIIFICLLAALSSNSIKIMYLQNLSYSSTFQ